MRTPLSMASPAPTIIVIEDETSMRRLLKTILAAQGYLVVEAETGRRGLVEAGTRKPDLVILDLGLPDMDGAQVIKCLREWSQIPIVVLSARDQESQKVKALDTGADDYLTKPFGAEELLARVRVALRHAARVTGSAGESEFSVGPLKVDLLNRKVWVADREVHLTPIEYRLLSVLVKHAGKTLTHRQLLHAVWGSARADSSHYLRIYMGQLRRKLEADPARPHFLLTEAGVGYRLAAE
jgi:two-component system, OmpR family, KDP operon response regulator KdpE